MLDNRRIAKKVTNWALELQCFNIVRVWIRGEANILSDAPSRAPWECALARHLPIGDAPVRQLIRDLYRHPEKIDQQIEKVIEELHLDEFKPLDPQSQKDGSGPVVTDIQDVPADGSGRRTPTFGVNVVKPRKEADFGQTPMIGVNLMHETYEADFGVCDWIEDPSQLHGYDTPVYPRWPMMVCRVDAPMRILPLNVDVEMPVPRANNVLPTSLRTYDPSKFKARAGGKQYGSPGINIVWPRSIPFNDGKTKYQQMFSVARFGTWEAVRTAEWNYFTEQWKVIPAKDI